MDNLIAVYKERLNLQDATFVPIVHDDAIVAKVYKIIQLDGKQSILKVCARKQDYLRELYFLEYFNGQLPVARIIQVVKPAEGIDGAILMEYFSGVLLNPRDYTEELAYEIGAILARIHLNRATGYGDLTQPNTLHSDPAIHFSSKFEEGLDECSDNLPKELLNQCRYYYGTYINLLTTVDGPCIIHRDFRPGNVVIKNGKLQGIIDWASGRASFAEEDFCPLELGEWGTDPINKNFFLAGYASIRPIPNYTAIMPLLQLHRTIATIGYTVKTGIWSGSHAHLYKINREFLEGFFNKV